MKNQKMLTWIQLFLTPGLMILLGLILILHPDFGSALIAKILGWAITLAGVGCILSAIASRSGMAGKAAFAIVCLALGGWLLRSPLQLAAAIGRVAGILLLVRSVQDIMNAVQWKRGITYSLICAAVGVLLIVLPMTTSRLVMTALGVVVLLLGIAMLADRLKVRKRLDDSDDPNIIDAL